MLNQFVLYIFLWILDNGSYTKVQVRNRAKIEAMTAYKKKNYKEAANQFYILSKQSFFIPPEVSLNYAHALFESKDTSSARKIYTRLSGSKVESLSSTTYVQLGLIYCNQKDTAKALSLFRQALVIQPSNDLARFNYELLKRKYKSQPDNQSESPLPKSHKTPPKPPTQEQVEVAKSNSQQELLKTLKNYGLTPEKARMILDAMKNSEIQYIQQRKLITKTPNIKTKQNW